MPDDLTPEEAAEVKRARELVTANPHSRRARKRWTEACLMLEARAVLDGYYDTDDLGDED